jgi:signal transduction histidine kinase
MLARVDPSVPEIVCSDPGRLRQVLINLVGNALKFTERGEIEISVAAEAAGGNQMLIRFQVRDTGRGIPKDQHQRIFEAFVQADGSMKRAHGGSGLGLAISSRLVAMMRGEIWVESAPARGSTFHFTIRAAAAPNPAESRGAA